MILIIISKQSSIIAKLQGENRKLQNTIHQLRNQLLEYRQFEIDIKEKMKGILETQKETNEILEERRKSKKIVCPECGIKIKIGEWYNKEKMKILILF